MRIYRIRKFPTKLVVLVLIVALIVISPKIRVGLKDFSIAILTKPLRILSKVGTYFSNKKNLANENLSLKQRLASISVELARMEDIALENKRLGKILKFKKTFRYKTIIAKVIARDYADWRSSLLINKGKINSIKEHMACATHKGLLGSVREVNADSSKVMLITDPNSRVGVMVEPSRESGLLVGMPKGGCKVIYLSLDANIKEGDRVLTAGFSKFFPKGLPIGTVKEVGIQNTKLYKYAVLDTFQNMNEIEEVVCIYAD